VVGVVAGRARNNISNRWGGPERYLTETVVVSAAALAQIITQLPPVLRRLESEEDEQRRGQRQQEFKHAHCNSLKDKGRII
jgi:hypothetical protein